MDEMEEILDDLFKEVGGILGVMAWMADWPAPHMRIDPDLTVRLGRLRRLVEALHNAIN